MVTEKIQFITVEQFDKMVELPENIGKRLEYIAGEIVEVPSNPFVSKIAALIIHLLLQYLDNHDIGHVTGEGGGYQISGQRFAPDVAFVSYKKQKELTSKGYGTVPPDLAIEVISDPDNKQELRDLRKKITSYHADDVIVWVIDPFERTAEIHRVGSATSVIYADGSLSAEDILAGFELKLSDILPPKTEDDVKNTST